MSVQTRIATSVFCAFSVFICGLFTISLALGVYVFYASDIGGGINYEYPINSVIGANFCTIGASRKVRPPKWLIASKAHLQARLLQRVYL